MLSEPLPFELPNYHVVFREQNPLWKDLNASFPTEGFQKNSEHIRSYGQRAHLGRNRTYRDKQENTINQVWVDFMSYLKGPSYNQLIVDHITSELYKLRFSWKLTDSDQDLSPHVDSSAKLFTHLFYFNEVWLPEWGGQLCFLGGKLPETNAPEISDFNEINSYEVQGDISVLAPCTENSWHAVTKVTSPEGVSRRRFQVNGMRV